MGIEVYMTKIIYFADDEKNIRDLVVPFLEHDGFTVRAFETGDLLLEAYKNQKPDLVILDIMMPGTNGLDVMKSIRQYDNIPIIMLTARDSDVDFITAFNLGTDDYFTKPFSPIKLSLHVKALFKRLDEKAIKNDTQYQFLDLTLDTEKRIALLSNEEMPLTKTEFDFLLVDFLRNKIWYNSSMNYEASKQLTDVRFKRLVGVQRTTFEEMLAVLKTAYQRKHAKGGRTPKLSLEDLLMATLQYMREYRTYEQIAADFGIHESNLIRRSQWVESTLIQSGFTISKTHLSAEDTVIVDATEVKINRPKKIN